METFFLGGFSKLYRTSYKFLMRMVNKMSTDFNHDFLQIAHYLTKTTLTLRVCAHWKCAVLFFLQHFHEKNNSQSDIYCYLLCIITFHIDISRKKIKPTSIWSSYPLRLQSVTVHFLERFIHFLNSLNNLRVILFHYPGKLQVPARRSGIYNYTMVWYRVNNVHMYQQ